MCTQAVCEGDSGGFVFYIMIFSFDFIVNVFGHLELGT